MEFRKVLALRGPNIWTNDPVMEVWVDLKELDRPSTDFPGFNDRLMSWLPTMIEHRCSIGERGGFFQRLRDGTYPGHILEHVTLELQSLAGRDVGFGKARETSEPGVYRWSSSTHEETSGARVPGRGPRTCAGGASRSAVRRDGRDRTAPRLGPGGLSWDRARGAIVEAAKARGIPARRLNTESLVLFGHGRKQRRIQAAETDRTGAIAEAIAQDKEMTRTLLQAVGVPVPEGRPVTDADDAWAAACEIGVPVVVKPQDGNQGRGVATNLTTREQVVAAYRRRAGRGQTSRSSRSSPPATTIACWSSATRWWPPPAASRPRCSATASTHSRNWSSRRIPIRAAASTMPRCSARSSSMPSPWRVLADQGYTADSVPPAGNRRC